MNILELNCDFLTCLCRNNDVLFIEATSDSSAGSKRLKKYKEMSDEKTKLRIRYSSSSRCLDDDLVNISLFMADHADAIIGKAMKLSD